MEHPYKSAPARSFWSQAVAQAWNPQEVPQATAFVGKSERVVSAGSCFAANIVPYLAKAGIPYVRTERPHERFSRIQLEGLSYDKFSAAYGNIYTPKQLLQLTLRAMGVFSASRGPLAYRRTSHRRLSSRLGFYGR